MSIPVQPIAGAEPLMCSHNVAIRIRAMGGRAVYGWKIKHDVFCDQYENHVVWEDNSGNLWDVTPVFAGVQGDMAIIDWPVETEFIRDDSAAFDAKARPGKYVPTKADRNIKKACKCMERADAALFENNLERCRYWTNKANQYMRRSGLPYGWASPTALTAEAVLRAV